MKKSTKIITGAVLVVAAAVLVLPRFLKPKEVMDEVLPPTVQVTAPEMGTIELFTGLIGTVEPTDVVYINPKMAGEVTEVFVKAGDMVAEGQTLCKIDTKQVEGAKISLQTASVSLSDAKATLERLQVLFSSGDISAQNLEQAQNGVKMAQLQYDGAKLAYDTQLEYSSITAPIGGVVETFGVSVHDMVAQQNLIAVISGEGSKAVTFSVTERIVGNLTVGAPIRIEKGGSEYHATVTEISSMVDQATGLFQVKASVEEAHSLATGTAVKLYVSVAKADNTMILPVDAVYYNGGEAYVYTYDAGTVHKVSVEVGIYDEKQIQLISGLTLDSQVITTWSPELYEGAPALLEEYSSQALPETAANLEETVDPVQE